MTINHNAVRQVVGVMGNVISFCLFLSPLPTFIEIIKKKAVEDFSPIPYLATLLNCMLWLLYGLPFVHPNSFLVITINSIGLVFESVYLTIFFIYATRDGRLKVLMILAAELVFMTVVIVVVLLTTQTHEKRTLIVGIFCIIFNIGMYAAPLAAMKLVIETKSVKYMPFTLSLVSFINGICWTTYAFLPFDINMAFPNGVGVLFSIAQLVLYACYCKSTPQEKSKTEVELSSASDV